MRCASSCSLRARVSISSANHWLLIVRPARLIVPMFSSSASGVIFLRKMLNSEGYNCIYCVHGSLRPELMQWYSYSISANVTANDIQKKHLFILDRLLVLRTTSKPIQK